MILKQIKDFLEDSNEKYESQDIFLIGKTDCSFIYIHLGIVCSECVKKRLLSSSFFNHKQYKKLNKKELVYVSNLMKVKKFQKDCLVEISPGNVSTYVILSVPFCHICNEK